MYIKLILQRIFKPIFFASLFSRSVIFKMENDLPFSLAAKEFFSVIMNGLVFDLSIVILVSAILICFLLIFDSKITKLVSYRYFFYKASLFFWFFLLSANAALEIIYWKNFGDRYNAYFKFFESYLKYKDIYEINLFYIFSFSLLSAFLFTKISEIKNIRKCPQFFTRVKFAIVVLILAKGSLVFIETYHLSNDKKMQIAKNGAFKLLQHYLQDKQNVSFYPHYYLSVNKKDALTSFRKQVSSKNEEFLSDFGKNISRWSHDNSSHPILSNKNVVIIAFDDLLASNMNEEILENSFENFSEHSIICEKHFSTHHDPHLAVLSLLYSKIVPMNFNSYERVAQNSLLNSLTENNFDVNFATDKYTSLDGFANILAKDKINSINRRDILQNLSVNHENIDVSNQLTKLWIDKADKLHQYGQKFFFLVNSSIMTTIQKESLNKNNINLRLMEELVRNIKMIQEKKWFKDTILIITSTASTKEISDRIVENYHIPLIYYSEGLSWNRKIKTVTSSADLLPTILSILNIPYLNNSIASNMFLKSNKDAKVVYGPVLGSVSNENDNYVLKTIEPGKIGYEKVYNEHYMKLKDSNIIGSKELIAFFQTYFGEFF